MRTHPKIREVVKELSKAEADRGQLVDIGWRAYRAVMLPGVSEELAERFRYAYFSGAQHLFASIVGVLDDDLEPTARDLDRMNKLHRELEGFSRELEGYIALHMKTGGNA